jgi:hypothetical protein
MNFDPLPGNPLFEGLNAGVIAFKQIMIIGKFTGKCSFEQADGSTKTIEIKDAIGIVDHVVARW